MKKKTIIREYHLLHGQKEIKGEVCIAFLTDIHNCLSEEERDCIFSMLEKVRPDVVLIGGDVLIGKKGKSTEEAFFFIKDLSERYKVIYASGNHEQRIRLCPETYGDMGNCYEEKLSKTKVRRIINQKIDFEINGILLTVYGFEPELSFYKKGLKPKGMQEALQRVFQQPDLGRYNILLAHNPRYGKEYLNWGAELTLSGHYHGGVLLLTKKRGVASPDFRIFSNDCCGIRRRGKSHMIVSAGLGEHTIPIRIHNPRELTVVRLS